MLNYAVNHTAAFLAGMPKTTRKAKGQFFVSAETANFMASMFNLSNIHQNVNILDPGAGTGILSIALIERISREYPNLQIHLTCYEVDSDVLPILNKNLAHIEKLLNGKLEYQIIEEDYILSQTDSFNGNLFADAQSPRYDCIVSNPPYMKIARNHPSALAMSKVVHGAPNLYFLFAAMSLFNLNDNAEMVYIIPRSWTSGAYFKAFRDYLLTEGTIEQIHLFVSRDKVFSTEQVLQETIIIKVKRSRQKPSDILITSSHSGNNFSDITKLNVPYNSIISGEDMYVYLPTNKEELDIIKKINTYQSTLPNEGLKMKTGIVVDFRQWNELRNTPDEHTLPLFYSQHIFNGRVNHQPSGKEYDWIVDEKPALIQKNKNYVFIKRFTAKEEKRRLQCGIYSPKDFKEYKYIGTENKINFVDRIDGKEMDEKTTYGVFALLNSTLFDKYYRILNGSTQVNSSEINNIPIPPVSIIKKIGEQVLNSDDLSTRNCDKIIAEVAYA